MTLNKGMAPTHGPMVASIAVAGIKESEAGTELAPTQTVANMRVFSKTT